MTTDTAVRVTRMVVEGKGLFAPGEETALAR